MAAKLNELIDAVANEVMDTLVDLLMDDQTLIAAEGRDSWIDASQFADVMRQTYLGALERARVAQDEDPDEDQEDEILLSTYDWPKLMELGHSGCMHDSDCACSDKARANDTAIEKAVLTAKRNVAKL